MTPLLNGINEGYLDNLNRIQSAMDLVQRQVSSGLRVGKPSDDPSAVPSILNKQSQIGSARQALTNFKELKAELEGGDTALQNGARLLEQAIGLATQAASSGPDAASKMATIELQIGTLQQQLVDLSRTSVGGRYIFSGDRDQQPLYAIDPVQVNGVVQLADAASTRAVTDAGGSTLWIPPTARDIFDARNADDTIASGNVFAAIDGLLRAIQNRDSAAAEASIDNLKTASEHLNQQLGLYGIAENRLSESEDATNRSLLAHTAALSDLRETDIAAAAIQLSELTLQQQASLSARAKVSQLSLFDFLA